MKTNIIKGKKFVEGNLRKIQIYTFFHFWNCRRVLKAIFYGPRQARAKAEHRHYKAFSKFKCAHIFQNAPISQIEIVLSRR